MSKYLYIFVVIVSLLTSCETSFGEKYTRGNLEIYFTDKVTKRMVENVADYFEENDLIQNHRHSIQLTATEMGSEQPEIVLKMILSKNQTTLPAEDSVNLALLQEDLNKEVFGNANFRIAVCNENFVEL